MGILLYIISELFPVTFLLSGIILFDIQLTIGVLNISIFYFQILDILYIDGGSHLKFEKSTQIMFSILRSISNIFKLKFFAEKGLSFCLFEGATTFNIIAFDYVTVIYSLALVIFIIFLMNPYCHTTNKCIHKIKGRKTHISKSVIHGLSGFLILCYARSTRVCIQLLTITQLSAKDTKKDELVLYYSGDIPLWSPQQLYYAIPAIFTAVFMTILPPLLLISYPLCYKVFGVLRIQESKLVRILCRVIPLEKLKPFFDSFQGAFKDKYRFFSGLYFIYRLLMLLTFAYGTYIIIYILWEIQLITILLVHAWVQPYKKKWHNRLDLVIFAILSIFNAITMNNFHRATSPKKYPGVFGGIQVALAYSPLIILVVYISINIWGQVMIYRSKKRSTNDREDQTLEISLSLVDQERDPESEYNKYD